MHISDERRPAVNVLNILTPIMFEFQRFHQNSFTANYRERPPPCASPPDLEPPPLKPPDLEPPEKPPELREAPPEYDGMLLRDALLLDP